MQQPLEMTSIHTYNRLALVAPLVGMFSFICYTTHLTSVGAFLFGYGYIIGLCLGVTGVIVGLLSLRKISVTKEKGDVSAVVGISLSSICVIIPSLTQVLAVFL